MTISTAIIKAYANQQRTMTNERLFKTNPIEPNSPARNPFFRSKIELCSTLSIVEGQISCPQLRFSPKIKTACASFPRLKCPARQGGLSGLMTADEFYFAGDVPAEWPNRNTQSPLRN
jgi:hypothetical protein